MDGISMTHYLLKIRALVNNLIGSGTQMLNKVIMYILDGLPPYFHPFTTIFKTKCTMTFNDVYHLLISKDLMVKQRHGEVLLVVVGSSPAFAAQSSRYKGKKFVKNWNGDGQFLGYGS